jgi:hypothetical protein
MHHRGAAIRRELDRGQIQEIIAVDAVEADNLMAQALQMRRDRGTHVTAMPSDQNAHDSMIGRRPVPTGYR